MRQIPMEKSANLDYIELSLMHYFSPLLRLVVVTAMLLALPLFSFAQSPGAATANEAAYTLFSAGKWAEATAAYEALLRDYPTDAIVPFANVQLALGQFFLGDFDKSQATLARVLASPGLSPEVTQVAEGFVPQVLSAKAASMPPGDPQRKALFQEAVKKFSDFLTKHPQSADVESSIYGRALANYQIGNFDQTIADLRASAQRFATSPALSATNNLLALAIATQGSGELTREGGDKAKGIAQLKEAEGLLQKIVSDKKDIAIINDANFQIGEILFARAASSPEAERVAIYQQAMAAYRAILPKESIVALQQDRIAGFPALKAAALRANNMALKKQLDKDNERELRKLQDIQVKADQIASAILKMGEIYFNAQKYNEARAVIRHIQPFLTTDDEKLRSEYFQVMTYTLQNAPDRAVAAYSSFQKTHKAPPIADNLPFALGNMFLGLGNPTEAIKYFDESVTNYPKGRLIGLSVVSKAQAQAAMKQFDEATKTFTTYLAQKPSPDIAVVAQYGLANIYKDSARWDEAIAAYRLVKEQFPTTPQATESDYWIAISTQQKGDHATAAPLLEAFIKSHASHTLAPLAMYALGGAQIALNKKEEGIATLALLAEKFPDSQPAPYTYFMRAQLRAAEQNVEAINSLMRDFIAKYPKDDKVFFAFDSIAQNAVNAGKQPEAIAAYLDFLQQFPENPSAPVAMIKIADLQRGNAERLATNFSGLAVEDQGKWKQSVQSAVSTIEEMVAKYPSSPDLATGLQSLLASQRLLVRAKLQDDAGVEKTFKSLSDTSTDATAKSKILFVLAGFLAEKDKVRSLALFTQAYQPEILYSPKDLDTYGFALLEQGKLEEASTVFEKLAADFPNPAGVTPTQATALVQEAQAIALFGRGRIAQEKKLVAEAGKLFGQLKALYPWSPKVLEADYGIAEALRTQGKLDEALQLLPTIIRANTATADLRANSMLLGGFIMVDKMNVATDPKDKENFLGAAIDYFGKIAQFYSGVPMAAQRGLWEAGQLLEKQAEGSADAKFKKQQLTRARLMFKQLVTDFPTSEYSPKAEARLTALGAE